MSRPAKPVPPAAAAPLARHPAAPLELLRKLHPRPDRSRVLLVMLPGVNDVAESFFKWGLVDALAHYPCAVDVVGVNTPLDDYLDQEVVARLEAEVIAPARLSGYGRFWFLGVSLGGMGSLLYARAHPAEVEGLILLAPYLGATGTIAAIARAGGLPHWQPDPRLPDEDDRSLLAWIKQHWSQTDAPPARFLGYGQADRFAASAQLLTPYVPKDRVVVDRGAHDWETWARLWSGILAAGPFGSDPLTASSLRPVP